MSNRLSNYCPSCPFKNESVPRGREGAYYCGERCLEEGSVVNFEKDFLPILTAEPGTPIPDPMTAQDRFELSEELMAVRRAQHLGYVATGIIEKRG